VELSWLSATGAASYDVYFGPKIPAPFRANQAGTAFYPGELLPGTTYHWRINSVNEFGAAEGGALSFRTQFPIIEADFYATPETRSTRLITPAYTTSR
jgi:hypothetical protein